MGQKQECLRVGISKTDGWIGEVRHETLSANSLIVVHGS